MGGEKQGERKRKAVGNRGKARRSRRWVLDCPSLGLRESEGRGERGKKRWRGERREREMKEERGEGLPAGECWSSSASLAGAANSR